MKFLLLATAFTFFAHPSFAMEAPTEETQPQGLHRLPKWEEVKSGFSMETTQGYKQVATRGRGGKTVMSRGAPVEIKIPTTNYASQKLQLTGKIAQDPDFLEKTFYLTTVKIKHTPSQRSNGVATSWEQTISGIYGSIEDKETTFSLTLPCSIQGEILSGTQNYTQDNRITKAQEGEMTSSTSYTTILTSDTSGVLEGLNWTAN